MKSQFQRNGVEIAKVFLRLGTLGFGGPLATMAMMEEETSRKRKWIPARQFAEIYALCKILPGPVATQMAIYLGFLRGGIAGGLLSGVLFILPAFFMVLGLSWLYVHTGIVRRGEHLLFGMQSAALAVVLLSTIQLARPYLKEVRAWFLAVTTCAVTLLQPAMEPVAILFAGVAGAFLTTRAARIKRPREAGVLLALFLSCLKAGTLVFGTGLAVVPMLAHDVVDRHAWLTRSEFMDGLAIGQITPGPFVIAATFIGFKTAALPGALAATAGIFLPSFFNILFLVPRIWGKLAGTPRAEAFTAWAIPAVIGGIIGTGSRLGMHTLGSGSGVACFAAALALGAGLRAPAWLVIPGVGAAWALVQAMF